MTYIDWIRDQPPAVRLELNTNPLLAALTRSAFDAGVQPSSEPMPDEPESRAAREAYAVWSCNPSPAEQRAFFAGRRPFEHLPLDAHGRLTREGRDTLITAARLRGCSFAEAAGHLLLGAKPSAGQCN